MSSAFRHVQLWSRTFHIYLSMLALGVLLFFAATGFMLNHPEGFGLDQIHKTDISGEVPEQLLAADQRLALVEKLRADFGATGQLDMPAVEDDDQQVLLPFYSPGRNCRVTIAKAEGSPDKRPVKVELETRGALGRISDLHKGEHAGWAWKRLIDGTSILLAVASITGIIMLLALPKRRRLGLIATAIGIALSVAMYFAMVP